MLKSPTQSSAIAVTRKVTQVTLLFAIVILLAGGGGLYLLNNKIGDEQKVEAAKMAEVGSNRQIASRYQTALATFTQTESQLQYLEAPVPQKEYVPTLLEQLQSLAKSTDLIVDSVRPGAIVQAMQDAPSAQAASSDSSSDSGAPPVKKQIPLAYSTMTVALQVDGTYAHVMRFIYDLPHFPKILSVQSISLHPDQGDQVSATMNITAYVFDPAKDVTLGTPILRDLQRKGIAPPIAGANVQAAAMKSGVMTPEARAIGVARNDAAVADEQAKGQGILEPEPAPTGAAGAASAGAAANGQGGTR